MKMKKILKLLTVSAAAAALYAGCASAGAEGVPRCAATGGILSSDLKTEVNLTCEGENALGSAAVMRFSAGSGSDAKINGSTFSLGWAFDFDRESGTVTFRKAEEAGMNGHLAKPYDIPTIMETLHELLG